MPTDYACHMLGTNTIATPATAWADVDGSTLTQAQFEAQFPASFRKPDVNGTRPVNWRLTNGSVGALGQWFGAGGVFLINTGD
jgi:hypothetical protein